MELEITKGFVPQVQDFVMNQQGFLVDVTKVLFHCSNGRFVGQFEMITWEIVV